MQVEKVLFGYPAHYGGLKVHDFLISVNGQEVFEMNHDQVVKLINNSGSTLNLSVERLQKNNCVREMNPDRLFISQG